MAEIVSALGYPLTDTMKTRFNDVFRAANTFIVSDQEENKFRTEWLSQKTNQPDLIKFGLKKGMWLVANLAQAAENVLRNNDEEGKKQLVDWGWNELNNYTGTDPRTLEGINKRTYKAATALYRMEKNECD